MSNIEKAEPAPDYPPEEGGATEKLRALMERLKKAQERKRTIGGGSSQNSSGNADRPSSIPLYAKEDDAPVA